MIAPVIQPKASLRELVYVPRVTNRVVRPANGGVVCAIRTVGDGGRVLDHQLASPLWIGAAIALIWWHAQI
ncbi:hypothetical protein [Nocardia sp. NPDC004260]